MRKIDIIMPVYNKCEYTKEAVATLKQHTLREDYHLILVDDASTDLTEQFMHQLDSDHSINCLGVMKPDNEGWCAAINTGMEHVGAEFVLICNNDIHFTEGWLASILEYFKDPHVGAVGPVSNYVSGLQHIAHNIPTVDSEEVKYLIGFFMVVRRSVLEQIRMENGDYLDTLFSPGGGDDLDLSLRIRKAGYKLIAARNVFIHHYGSATFRGYIAKRKLTYEDFWKKGEEKLEKKWGKEVAADLKVSPSRLRIAVCTPYRTNFVHTDFVKSLFGMTKIGEVMHVDAKRVMISEARNLMVKYALDNGATHILFVDDDMEFPHDTLIRLLNHKVDIVGAVAFQRAGDHLPCTYNLDADQPGMLCCVECLHQGLVEMDAVGSSCILIRAEVFKKLAYPWYVWADKSLGVMVEKGGLGEDLSFCIRARQAGFKVHVDTDFIITHIGNEIKVNEDYYQEFKRRTNLVERLKGPQVEAQRAHQ